MARGNLALRAADDDAAREHFRRALELARETDEYATQVAALSGLAPLGEPERWDEARDAFRRFRERMPRRDELRAACAIYLARPSPEARGDFAALVDRYCRRMTPQTRALALQHDPLLRELARAARGE